MKRALCVTLAVIAVLASPEAVRADITTVILSQDASKDFEVNAQDKATQTATLTFAIGPAPTANAKVKECVLRVVPVPIVGSPARADQDVSVLWGKEQVGGWSADGDAPKPYLAQLQEKACLPGQSAVFTFRTDSLYTAWTYHGVGATRSADRPRLIVTYDSPDAARSAEATGWTYKEPAAFFSSELWKFPGTLLANPVFYGRAVYLIVGSSDDGPLYRLGSVGDLANWSLQFALTDKSFAFVTVQGQLQLITKNAIFSCDLTALQGKKTAPCNQAKDTGELTVNEKEPPAMGADGSLYFKNVQAGGAAGSIVAFNPSLRQIWTTDFKLDAVSPIALSANGRYAYALASISADATRRNLLRIDTTTGDVAPHEFIHCPLGSPPCEQPALLTLLRPVAVTKVNGGDSIDYVFVAGNTSDKGYLQLLAFGEHAAKPRVIWSQQLGQPLSTAPALGVGDDSLYVASGGTIIRYAWYGSKGLLGSSASPPPAESQHVGANVSKLLVDQGGSLYLYTDKGLYTYLASEKRLSKPQELGFAPTALQFTPEGALMGYTDKAVYDLSPKARSPLIVSAFDKETIYSATSVTLTAGAVAKAGERITVKGENVTFQNGFHWPVGATLYVQSGLRNHYLRPGARQDIYETADEEDFNVTRITGRFPR